MKLKETSVLCIGWIIDTFVGVWCRNMKKAIQSAWDNVVSKRSFWEWSASAAG